ncbi:MAG: T9SS type A sorting domain-containing protein [Flavobacteriales bacterium]|nr:T9SS type A sorting domain-containing protein [Flavobacteriales bacterium]MCB9448921.1 T9SS type A sorting domain-containing protein [Flavobacteriales bacterium]
MRHAANKTAATITIVDMGNAANAYTCAAGASSYLWLDPETGTISFTHRADPATTTAAPGSGYLLTDVSKDGGATWNNNLGPVYTPSGAMNARYPMNVVYNPNGNTDPDSTRVVYGAPVLGGTNGATAWGNFTYGTYTVGTGAITSHVDTSNSERNFEVSDDMHAIRDGGEMFVIHRDRNYSLTNIFQNKLILSRLTYSGGDVTAVHDSISHVTSMTVDTTNVIPTDAAIAFSPNGNTGWISVITHTSFSLEADSSYYLALYKSTDGGATWGSMIEVPISTLPGIGDSLNPLNDTTYTIFTTAFDHDLAVDKNGNPHVFVAVGHGSNAWTISTGAGYWGLFDIYSADGGTTWAQRLVAKPQTFRGSYGNGANVIDEDPRPQIAVTPDGNKLFFVWFDTDTTTFGPDANLFRDCFMQGYDVTTGFTTKMHDHPTYPGTSTYNYTAGTDADGVVNFANVSYYAKDDGSGNYCVPVNYMAVPDVGNTLQAVAFKYIDGLCVTESDFTGVVEKENNVFAITNSYPNPFSDQTTVTVELKKTAKVRLTVTNILGQVIMSQDYGQLIAGRHGLTILRKEMNSGIYFATVEADGFSVSQKLVVR